MSKALALGARIPCRRFLQPNATSEANIATSDVDVYPRPGAVSHEQPASAFAFANPCCGSAPASRPALEAPPLPEDPYAPAFPPELGAPPEPPAPDVPGASEPEFDPPAASIAGPPVSAGASPPLAPSALAASRWASPPASAGGRDASMRVPPSLPSQVG